MKAFHIFTEAKETKRWEARFLCMELRVQETTLVAIIGKLLKGSIMDSSHVLNSCICSAFQAGIYLLIYRQYVPAVASGYQSCEASLSTPSQASPPSCHQGWFCSQTLLVKLLSPRCSGQNGKGLR